jgi:ATP-binding cassette subfamily B protein
MKFNRPALKLAFKFFQYLLPYSKRQLLLIVILSIGSSLVGLINPYLTKLIIDDGISKKDLKAFVIFVSLGAAVFLLTEFINGANRFLNQYVRVRISFDLNRQVFRKLRNLSFSWFQEKTRGEELYLLNHDIDTVTNFITTSFPQALLFFCRLLFILIILFYLNYKIAILALLLSLFLYLPPYYFKKMMQKAWEALVKNSQEVFRILDEFFSHIHLIKVFAKEIATTRAYLKRLIIDIRIRMKNLRLEILSGFANNAGNKTIIGLVGLYGGYQVIKGNLTLGSLTAITAYIYQLMGLPGEFSNFFHSASYGLISCQRINAILEERPKVVESINAKEVIFPKGEIIFQDVSFGYFPNKFVLNKLNFHVTGGGHIALVGPSGCGKTTLLNLLVRLYEPWGGEIIIDQWNINKLKLHSLRKQIGFALQEPFLWNQSIENNIKYGREEATREEILAVAKLTGIDDFVRDFPRGYQTLIGEDASKISEGQKQRIAIARALIKNPKILILDEAMASMDSASEEKIISNIKSTQKDLTLITVSHRLSTVMSADLAYYFFKPDEMIVDNPQNLCEYNREFIYLFTGQEKILV